jgi:hypothetical protein
LKETEREEDLMESERRRFLVATAALSIGTLATTSESVQGDDKALEGV